MGLSSIGHQSLAIGGTDTKPTSGPKSHSKLEDAAGQFEALMIGQLLESLTKTGSPSGEESSGTSLLEMGKDQLAQAISAGGGLGLKKTILNSLKPA